MSRDQQVQLGLQSAAQVYKQMPVLPDNIPETQYIRQLGKRLVATIPPEHTWPFEFQVVAQKRSMHSHCLVVNVRQHWHHYCGCK
jgi:predicted Zn-dependent protease